MIVAGLIAAAVGALVALPALRLGGIFLSLATFAFALFFDSVMVKFDWVSGGDGVIADRSRRGRSSVRSTSTTKRRSSSSAWSCSSSSACSWCGCGGGTTGRFLDALRGSETAAASIGINPTRWRITAFALSAGIAGVGGGAARDARTSRPTYGTSFVAQLGLVWVVVVVSLGSRTVEGAIQAGVGFIFFQRVVLEDWIPWLFNHAFVPVVLILGAIITLRLVTRRFVVPACGRRDRRRCRLRSTT